MTWTVDGQMRRAIVHVPSAESPDGKAYVIDVKSADNFAARLFIDEQTHLPLMVTYKGPQPRIMTQGGPEGSWPGGVDPPYPPPAP